MRSCWNNEQSIARMKNKECTSTLVDKGIWKKCTLCGFTFLPRCVLCRDFFQRLLCSLAIGSNLKANRNLFDFISHHIGGALQESMAGQWKLLSSSGKHLMVHYDEKMKYSKQQKPVWATSSLEIHSQRSENEKWNDFGQYKLLFPLNQSLDLWVASAFYYVSIFITN